MSVFASACKGLRRRFVGALGLALLMSAPAMAAEFSDAQKTEIGQLVKTYLLQNPEVLRDAMVELDKRDKAQEAQKRETNVRDQSALLLNSPYGEELGNPNGKVTLVEFFDYNCGYCKRALDDMAKLLKTEPELRVVLKDFPVLGPGSVEAAQVAGAVRNQLKGEKFWAFHYKLLSTHGPVGKAQALAAAKDSGVDMDQLSKDLGSPAVKAGIEQNMQLADSLSLTGTPSYVLGPEVVVGAVGYDELKGRLDNVVKCGKASCS
ncbi:DsbA family protein [Lichenifustis flavocetrariae]|uniref:DsbA family protein n=1 Tax=Lichenifustis flavocetrariae TaxID=2949735 RepID=A0AA41YTQ8_9HYPH|nr:DsbA family protein [Lichenifustis flavocetrariae]MCW6507155.1 DsbA family protein [Lichenifustis flavocetrariae]